MRRLVFLALAMAVVTSSQAAVAVDPSATVSAFDEQAALRVSEGAVGGLVGDYPLLDRDGRSIQFSRFHGKPLLVSLIYTKCTQVCPMTTRNLSAAVRALQEAFGADSFNVLSVGFDTDTDTPQAMRSFARRQGVDLPNWEFASTDAPGIARLARTLGFSYRPSPAGFDHISQLTVVDAQGRVYRQVYGDAFELPSLGEPLKLLLGRGQIHYPLWQSLGRRVQLFCTTFDTRTGRYRADYSFFVSMLISAAMVIPFGYWLVRELRRVFGPASRGA
jgi:protein SCO1/2